MQSLEDFMGLLSFLPNEWTDEGINNLEDNPGHDQQIPAEAPLELVVQIFLNLRDDLHGPGKYTTSNPLHLTLLTQKSSIRRRPDRRYLCQHDLEEQSNRPAP